MFAFDFSQYSLDSFNLEDAHHFVDTRLSQLKDHEFVFFRFNNLDKINQEYQRYLEKAISYSSEVYMCISEEDYASYPILVEKYFSLGIRGFCLRVKTDSEKFVANHYTAENFKSGDVGIVEKFHHHLSKLPKNHFLAIEFEIEQDSRLIPATLANVHKLGVAWATIRVTGHPVESDVEKMKNLFNFLRMRRCNRLHVYFDFTNIHRLSWQLLSMNTFSGLRNVHIDISNRCTHSCVFCGLYSPTVIKELKSKNGGKIPNDVQKLMNMEIDSEKCMDIIFGLPFDVELIQFGGAGDPLMHKNAVDFIAAARKRGFAVEVLSNMEYLTNKDLERLTELGSHDYHSLRFIANVSGGTAETYMLTRPRQSEKVFQKVIKNLKHLHALRKLNNGVGVTITLMCVINRLNLDGIQDVCQLSIEVGAHEVWFKPMELYSELMRPLLPIVNERKKLANELKYALQMLDEKSIKIFDRNCCEKIIQQES